MNAYKVYHYWLIYKEYLIENNLADDSLDIEAEVLIEFVDNHISKEDKKYLSISREDLKALLREMSMLRYLQFTFSITDSDQAAMDNFIADLDLERMTEDFIKKSQSK